MGKRSSVYGAAFIFPRASQRRGDETQGMEQNSDTPTHTPTHTHTHSHTHTGGVTEGEDEIEEIYFDASTTWYVSVCMNVPNEAEKMRLYVHSASACAVVRVRERSSFEVGE